MTAFRFYIGTHASSAQPSLHKCEVDFDKKTFTPLYSLQGISDPTYLAGPKDSILYALGKSEGGGAVYALKEESRPPAGSPGKEAPRDSAGEKEPAPFHVLNSLPSGGQGPCHISVDPAGEFLLCANYSSGSVALYDLNRDGSLRSLCDFRQYEGVGFDAEDRQKGTHAHFAAFHPLTAKQSASPAKDRTSGLSPHGEVLVCDPGLEEVLVCDLGLDTVHVYELDRRARKLVDTTRSLILPQGSGPRHLAFHEAHPGMLYVLTEMANTIYVYEYREYIYSLVQRIPAVPSETDADPSLMQPSTADNSSIGCAIRFTEDGKYLFVSSRLGYQSISAFRCGKDGRLRFCSRSLCGGITPRDFNLFEEPATPAEDRPASSPSSPKCHLLVANQDSDLITALEFDQKTETLSLLDMKMQAVKPTCILADTTA